MPIRFTKEADADIIRLYIEGAERFGAPEAEKYIAGFEAACAFIERSPLAVRERSEFEPPMRIHPYRSHVIIFVVEEGGVLVIRVRHAREDWASNPSEVADR
ncbi:MAG: type II toxin-antitoxin system RelE/ParE family toxin [Parvularculaceae bacterium]|nr:type II toxin-antitoxin system RelE/ParE family toxin [Parvularculaceae bacterium]